MRRGDLIIDVDYLFSALSGLALHDKPQELLRFVLCAKDAAIAQIGLVEGIKTAWIIESNPTDTTINTYKTAYDAEHVQLRVGAAECKRRIDADTNRTSEQRAHMHTLVDQWHETNPQ
jgi:hypothetical protein